MSFKIMNDIFNQYSDFTIVYIDDMITFSKTMNNKGNISIFFLKLSKKAGLAVSAKKTEILPPKLGFLDTISIMELQIIEQF